MADRKLAQKQDFNLSLLRHADDGSVVPQLIETASWLASWDRQIFSSLLEAEPRALLGCDTVRICGEDKAQLAERLLDLVAAQSLFRHDVAAGQLHKLNHPGLEGQLATMIEDQSRPVLVRDLAIDIAVACKYAGLSEVLLHVVLAADEDYWLRISACWAIVRLGNDSVIARLRPLALGHTGPDPEGRLKDLVLSALGLRRLGADEFFEALTLRSRRHSMSMLHSEVYSGRFFETLHPEHLPVALRWVASKKPLGSNNLTIQRLAWGILRKAWHSLNDAGILESLAATALALFRDHE